MNRPARLAAAALALLLAAGAAPPPSPQSRLLAADRSFSRLAAQRGRPYAFFATMATDGRAYGLGGEAPVIGRAQAFRRLARRDPGRFSRAPETAQVSPDGRMGWTSGQWTFTARGNRQTTGGNYLTVWVMDRNGAWKVQADIGASDSTAKR